MPLVGKYLLIPKSAGYTPPLAYDPALDRQRQERSLVAQLAQAADFTEGEARYYLSEHEFSYAGAWAAVQADRAWEREQSPALRDQRTGTAPPNAGVGEAMLMPRASAPPQEDGDYEERDLLVKKGL